MEVKPSNGGAGERKGIRNILTYRSQRVTSSIRRGGTAFLPNGIDRLSTSRHLTTADVGGTPDTLSALLRRSHG